jgi:hypothetical protein
MTCTAYSSSNEVSLYYTADTDDAALWTSTVTWKPIPITGESISANLSSVISEQITPTRSHAGSKLSQGEVSGSFNFEAQAGDFFFDMLIAVLQADKKTSVNTNSGGAVWADGDTIKNGSTKHCFALLKRIQVPSGDWDWYIFRGVQVGSMSLEIAPNSLISGTVNVLGIRPEVPQEDAAKPGTWTLSDLPALPLMSGVDSLQDFDIRDGVVSASVTMQSVSMTFDNQLRQQQAVGINSIYAVGVASGRFMASYSGNAYYSSPSIYNALVNGTDLSITGQLLDSFGSGIQFESSFIKVTSGAVPTADGPDQDLMVSTEFRAFEDDANGTVSLRLRFLSGPPLEFTTADGLFFVTANGVYFGVPSHG